MLTKITLLSPFAALSSSEFAAAKSNFSPVVIADSPAANDNGSGVAALLELSRLLPREQLKRAVRFVAFTNEEPPFFRTEQMGSHKYAQLCHQSKDQIAAMVSLETIGFYTDKPKTQRFPLSILRLLYPTTGNFISFISNLQLQSLLNKCIASFRQTTKFPSQGIVLPAVVPGISLSDHLSFWQLGYPAIMITDTAYLRYPHYHEAEDTPEKIDYDKLALVVAGLSRIGTGLDTFASSGSRIQLCSCQSFSCFL